MLEQGQNLSWVCFFDKRMPTQPAFGPCPGARFGSSGECGFLSIEAPHAVK
jgi:hypothetical protein